MLRLNTYYNHFMFYYGLQTQLSYHEHLFNTIVYLIK